MSKITGSEKQSNCVACNFLINGVKTRKSIPHTCGRTWEEIYKLKTKKNKYEK